MIRSRYTELLDNVREAVDIAAGKKAPERVYLHPTLDVKAIRAKLDLSQDKFAALLGISRRTLEGWEQGRRKPTGPARQLLRVANRFPSAVYEAIFDLPAIDAAGPGTQSMDVPQAASLRTSGKRSPRTAPRPTTTTGAAVLEESGTYAAKAGAPGRTSPGRKPRGGAKGASR